jgi:hypothetical protein
MVTELHRVAPAASQPVRGATLINGIEAATGKKECA